MDEGEPSKEDDDNNHREVKFPDDDDDLNINEIEQLDEILGSSGKGKLLEYERQMFLDCVYNDGLVICGK